MTSSRQLLQNTIATYVSQATILLVGLFLTPFLVGMLGDVQFGIWSLTGSLLAYSSVLDLGFSTAVAKYVAQYRAQNKPEGTNQMASTMFFVHCALGLFVLLAALLFSPFFAHVFNVPDAYAADARAVLIIAGLNFGVTLCGGVFNAVIVGYQRLDLNHALNVASQLLKLALIVVLLREGFGLIGLSAATLGITVLLIGSRLRIMGRIAPCLKVRLSAFNRRTFSSVVVKYSGLVFGLELTRLMLLNTNPMVISRFLSVADVTYYTIAFKVSQFILLLSAPLSFVLFPRFAELHALEDRERVMQTFSHGTRITLTLTSSIACFILIMGSPLIALWVGDEYVTKTVPILNALTLFFMFYANFGTGHSFLVGSGRVKWYLAASSAIVAANVTLGVTLVGPFLGLGVALSSAIPVALIYGAFLFPYTCRLLGLPLGKFLQDCLLPALLPAFLAGGGLWILSQHVPAQSILVLVIEFSVYLALFAIIHLLLLKRDTREQYIHSAGRVFRRAKI